MAETPVRAADPSTDLAPTLQTHHDSGAPSTEVPPTQVPFTEVMPPLADSSSQTIGGYTIEGELGRGGMGVVYRARQPGLNRIVALKMILHADHAGIEDRLRFLREAEALAKLRHENIVQVIEFGEHDGNPFFSLEYVEGGSLNQFLREGPLQQKDAAALVEKLARAMQAAHEAGIIHRDLKPANILLAKSEIRNPKSETAFSDFGFRISDWSPKVTDFGLAKKLDEAGLSASGAVMGTPSYMAPEQAAGKVHAVDARTDVYALGAILYECLTGRPPFKAATLIETLQQVITDEPVPVRTLQPGVSADLETICLKCLHKEPGKRYASAQALAEDLGRFLNGEAIRARPVGGIERAVKWARRRPAVAALVLLALLSLVSLAVLSGNLVVARGDAEQKRQAAEQEADKATSARDFLVSIFELSDASSQTSTMTARQILDDAEKRIPREFAEQPELQAELQKAIEGIYDKMLKKSPLAMLLEVHGAVQLHSTREAKQQAVPQTLLYSGDRLSLAEDAQVRLVVLFDLHQERLQAGREAIVRRKGCQPAEAVRERSEDILMPFVRLPRGSFYMGWDGKKKGRKTEIKEDFEIAVHDVTQGQWQAVMGNNPSVFSRFGGFRSEVKDITDEELKLFPVESVSWYDVEDFLKKLNEKESGRGWLYRLPREAEWEYACRNGATSEEECSYHFYFARSTNDLSSDQANINGQGPGGKAPLGKWLGRTTRVGAYPPNKLGLCDMHGNVFQWCADLDTGSSYQAVRGGCWRYGGAANCEAAYRIRHAPADRFKECGFRLVRVPSGGR